MGDKLDNVRRWEQRHWYWQGHSATISRKRRRKDKRKEDRVGQLSRLDLAFRSEPN